MILAATLPQRMQARTQHSSLVARRNEMKEQLEALTTRRGQLAQERLNAIARVDAGSTADKQLVAEYSGRIDEMGARIVRLERDIERANEQILQTMQGSESRVIVNVPGAAAPPGIPQIPIMVGRRGGDLESRYQKLMLAEALVFVLLGVTGWRALTRRMRRAELRAASTPAIAEMRTAVESIAVEVERISENQRYITKLLTERESQKLPVGEPNRAR